MRLILGIVLNLCLACNSSPKISPKENPVEKKGKYDQLLKLYRPVTFDTFHVFAAEDPGHINFKYRGVEIDSFNASLFPSEIVKAHFGDPPGLFACYRFSIDKNREALITRTPSTYVPSSIKLFVLNKSKESIEHYIELAELIGDAGDLLTKKSWLIKDRNDMLSAFVWQKNTHDHSIDEEPDTYPENSDDYLLIGFLKAVPDTLSQDSAFLAKKFKSLINQ